MTTYLLDADTLCDILRRRDERDKAVMQRFRQALSENARFILCPVTLYEVLRGLIRRNATGQLQFLNELSTVLSWDELRRSDWETAARLWAECSAKHLSPDDGDPVIAAHAKRHRAIVVTSNEKHFLPLGVPIENWRKL